MGFSIQPVNGYPLAYLEAGAGAPLVLIHGSLNDARAWTQQLATLADEFHVVAVSLRHCHPERWDGTGSGFSVRQHADDVAAFIAARGLRPAHVVGHSRGGAVAIALALDHPEDVRSLVLADPGGLEALLPDTPEGRAMAGQSAAMFARLRDDLAAGDRIVAARVFVDALGGAGAWERRTPAQRQVLLDNIVTGPHCAERPAFSPGELASLRGPLLLVTGAGSPPRYASMLHELARIHPSGPLLATIPGAAHAMNRENPEAFDRVLRGFLRSG